MGFYMIQGRLSKEAFKAMASSDTDRREVVGKMLEQINGKLHGYYFAFGGNDIVAIIEGPDNVSVASVAIAVGSSGTVQNITTTPLLSYEEGMEAIRGAASVTYTPPGQ